jgi:hypothetical protein
MCPENLTLDRYESRSVAQPGAVIGVPAGVGHSSDVLQSSAGDDELAPDLRAIYHQ